MSDPISTCTESDADIMQGILAGRYRSVVENSGIRPLRRELFAARDREPRSDGRFIGIFTPAQPPSIRHGESSLFDGDALAVFSGVFSSIENLIRREAVPNCPACGEQCIEKSLAELSASWNGLEQGVLLVGMPLEATTASSAENLTDQLDFWGAERAFDGERLWSREQIGDGWQQRALPVYAILDSASLPASTGFDLQLQRLVERVQVVSSRPLSLFYRERANGAISALGVINTGWFCPSCLTNTVVTPETPRSIGTVALSQLPQLSVMQLLKSCEASGISDKEFSDAARVLSQAGFATTPLNASVLQLGLAQVYLLRMAAAVIAGLSDMLFVLDEAPELFGEDLRVPFDQLVVRLQELHNCCVSLGVEPEAKSLGGVFSGQAKQRVVVASDEVRIELPVGGMAQLNAGACAGHTAEYFLPGIAAAANDGISSSMLPWHKLVYVPLTELRCSTALSLAAKAGLLEPLFNLIETSRPLQLSDLSVRGLKKNICPRCLGLRNVREQQCSCSMSPAACEALLSHKIKGRSFRSWIEAPLQEVVTLFQGYAQSAALTNAFHSVGTGPYTLATPISALGDGDRQQFKVLAAISGTERDLYKRSRTRREAGARLFLFTYPFLGLTSKQALRFEEQIHTLVLPDDTIGYLDSRLRFKNHDQCAMVPV